MGLKEELNELFTMINNRTEEIEFVNFMIRMKNGTIFKYKMDKKKEFRIRLKEELLKSEERKKMAKKKSSKL